MIRRIVNLVKVLIKILLLALTLLGLSGAVLANNFQQDDLLFVEDTDQEFITLGMLEFPPYAYSEAGSQECIGYVVETTKKIFAQYGFNVKSICAPAIRVYRMIQSGKVDLTVNVQSTKMLQDHVVFFPTPYSKLDLLLISHKDRGFENLVSGIRGFDYHGQREKLVAEGFIFQDTPGSIDAVRMFVRERTRHLITYKIPYKFYLEQNSFDVSPDTDIKFLLDLPTFYAISNKSKHKQFIIRSLEDLATKTQVNKFEDISPLY